MSENDQKQEPTAYELYRQLKAAGVTSSVVSSGQLLVAVDKPVPDAPGESASAAASE